MKIRLFTLSALSFFALLSQAQTLLYNDGATVTIQPGAVLYVEGGVTNTATGTINNDGTLEVKGDFLNQGTWDSTDPNTIKFSGDANSSVTSGGATFRNVVIAKGSGFNVNLMDDMSISTDLDFAGTNNKINIGAFDLNFGDLATVTGPSSTEYIITDDLGSVFKSFSSTGSFLFPIGFDANGYNPVTLNITAGPAETFSARVGAAPTDGDGLSGDPITTDVVNAVWVLDESTTGGNTYDITLGWQESEELVGFNDALNAVSFNDGNGWDALFTDLGPEVSNTRTRTGLTNFGAFAVGDKTVANTVIVNAKVYLEGPYNAAAGMMHDSLRVNDYIPLTEPYTGTPYSYLHKAYGGAESVPNNTTFDQPTNPDDVIDWVIVELRNSAVPTDILATKAALLQRDGSIVDLDGVSPLAIEGMADGNYYIGIRHRTHLGVRSNSTYALSNTATPLIDFTIAGTAFDDPSVTKPASPMKTLSGGPLGLWSGDANFNGIVAFNGGGNDKNIIISTLGSGNLNSTLPGYNRTDVNMNGVTSFNGAANDKNVILANVTSADINSPLTAHNNN